MKKRILYCFAIVFVAGILITPDIFAQVKPSQFPYKAQIQGKITRSMLYRAPVEASILEKCSNLCSNARIFDSTGREIPFVIHGRGNDAPSPSDPLDILSLDEKKDRVILTLKRKNPGQAMNNLEISTEDRDFHKEILIEGSNDDRTWRTLGKGPVYDFSSQVNLRRTAVPMNPNSYSILRCTIKTVHVQKGEARFYINYNGLNLSTSMHADKKIRIDGFFVKWDGTTGNKAVYEERQIYPAINQGERSKTTDIFIETRLPAEKIQFTIDDPFYIRDVTIYGSQSNKKDDLHLLGQTSIYNLPISEAKETKNYVDIPGGKNYRYYKLVIANRGNPPIRIVRLSIKWIQKELFFVGLDSDRQYWLYTGNDKIQPFSYDIAAMVNQENKDKQAADPIIIGPVVSNPDYIPGRDEETKAKIERFLLIGSIFILVIVAGFLLYRLWKKA